MTTLDQLMQGIVADPQSEDRWEVLADYLEEHDDPRRAELLRLHRRMLATCTEPERHPEREAWQARMVELLGAGVRPCVPQKTVVLAEHVLMTFSFIPAGSFLMGSPETEMARAGPSERLHEVRLTHGFWMAIFPVTQAQWKSVMGGNPSRFKGDDRPVEKVSWDECVAFCTRVGHNCRLPFEHEWEWACRSGTTTAFYTGNDVETGKRAGWWHYHRGLTRGRFKATKPVGQLEPNAWGLYDLYGNVWELTKSHADTDRDLFIMRGGCFVNGMSCCRSASRGWADLNIRYYGIGFRVCLDPD